MAERLNYAKSQTMRLTSSQEKLYRAQDQILMLLKKQPRFPYVLSGGTALSRFYFHHRFSEDLDFFYEGAQYSFEKIESIMHSLRKQGIICELIGRSDQTDHLKVASYIVSPQRSQVINVDFLEDPFSGMWSPLKKKTESGLLFRVDDLDMIYYRKFFSLLEQWHRSREIVRTKDWVDLYVLHCYHRPIEKTLAYYREHHVPVETEKIILIMDKLKKKDLQAGLKNISVAFKADEMWQTFKSVIQKLLKEGLNR